MVDMALSARKLQDAGDELNASVSVSASRQKLGSVHMVHQDSFLITLQFVHLMHFAPAAELSAKI